MTSTDAIELYEALEAAGVLLWIDGGWAVDALVGRQTRPHGDLDIAVREADVVTLRAVVEARGFHETAGRDSSRWNFVLADARGRKLDVHVAVLDESGRAIEGIAYPDGSLTGLGTIEGRTVKCIAPEFLVAFRRGYEPRESDRHDVALLCERFGLENPLAGPASTRDESSDG